MKEDLKIVFMGTPDFAAASLRKLIEEKFNVIACFTNPDKPSGRGMKLKYSEVKEVALENNIKLLKPENINSDDSYKTLSDLSPDFLIVVAYGKLLSKRILSIPKIMPVNIHGSLLPILRGASPVEHALLYGFCMTGTTLQKMDYKLDEGDIILQDEFEILENWQFYELYEEIKKSGVSLLKKFFSDTQKYISNLKKQDDKKATFCGKIKKEDGKLDFTKDALILHNMTKAFVRYPTAFCFYDNFMIKVFKSEYKKSDNKSDFGKIIEVNNNGIFIQALNGVYIIKELQKEGKKKQTVKEFLCGNKLNTGEYFK